MARGRKSSDSQATPKVVELRKLPEPPKDLTDIQTDIWRTVLASSAGDYIKPEAYPVLSEYCRAVSSSRRVAEVLNRFKPDWANEDDGLKRWDKLHAMQDRAARLVSSLAVKLRLTPSTRIYARSAGVAERNHSDRKPWQFDGGD